MRIKMLSTYFAGMGEVYVYNLDNQTIHSHLPGEYVMVYRQTLGSSYKPKAFPPTTDRMICICPFAQGLNNPIARGSFIRFNSHFRNIHELVLYPTLRTEELVRPEPLAPTTPRIIGRSNIVAGSGGPINTEAGMRFSPSPQCCRLIRKSEYRDAEKQMRDGCLEAILEDPEAIRSRGSTICFGMVMHQDGKSGFEFCQVELAAADGKMRELIVGIKIPGDEKLVSSLYIHRQELTDCMYDLHQARLRGNYEGLFVIKKYGTPMKDMRGGMLSEDTTPRSKTKDEDEERKSIWEGQLWDVARACIDNDRFNAGTFEEWLQPFLDEDVDGALRKLDFITFLYIQERLAASLELNALRGNPVENLEDDDLFQDLEDSSEEIRVMKQRVYVTRDGENYVKTRCEMLEYESAREKEYGAALADDTKPRFSGGRQQMKKAGASLSNSSPGLAQKNKGKSEEKELKDILMSAMSGKDGEETGSGMGNTEVKKGKAPVTAEEQELGFLLMKALKPADERDTDTSQNIGNSHDTVMKSGVEEETAKPTSTEKSKATMIVEVLDEKPDVVMKPEARRPTEQQQSEDENEKIEKLRLLKLKSISPEKSMGGEEMEDVVREGAGKGEMEDAIEEREEGECDGVCTLI